VEKCFYLILPLQLLLNTISIRTCNSQQSDQQRVAFKAGYCNVTAAIDGVKFSISSGNIEAGTIKLYGIR
jgi:hypothetical protein